MPCKFPFIHNGITFTGCTTRIGKDEKTGKIIHGNPWCSTRTTDKNRRKLNFLWLIKMHKKSRKWSCLLVLKAKQIRYSNKKKI